MAGDGDLGGERKMERRKRRGGGKGREERMEGVTERGKKSIMRDGHPVTSVRHAERGRDAREVSVSRETWSPRVTLSVL